MAKDSDTAVEDQDQIHYQSGDEIFKSVVDAKKLDLNAPLKICDSS
jgi:hypothetical protein